jgi:hypothetical protein
MARFWAACKLLIAWLMCFLSEIVNPSLILQALSLFIGPEQYRAALRGDVSLPHASNKA